MVIEACKSGITGCFPALNYRTIADLRQAILEIKNNCNGPIGVNLIVNKFNTQIKQQLEACVDLGVDYIITSFGNPKYIVELVHPIY